MADERSKFKVHYYVKCSQFVYHYNIDPIGHVPLPMTICMNMNIYGCVVMIMFE